jgi:hypothetical protein
MPIFDYSQIGIASEQFNANIQQILVDIVRSSAPRYLNYNTGGSDSPTKGTGQIYTATQKCAITSCWATKSSTTHKYWIGVKKTPSSGGSDENFLSLTLNPSDTRKDHNYNAGEGYVLNPGDKIFVQMSNDIEEGQPGENDINLRVNFTITPLNP